MSQPTLRHCRLLLPLGLLVSVLVAVSPPAALGATLIKTAPKCSSSFRWYSYTRAALATCGIKTYPLTSVVRVTGGGKDYEYALPKGEIAHEYVVPKGFDAATASPALRADYGIAPGPPAGSSPAEIALWAKSLKHVTFGPPTPFLATSDAHAPAPPASSSGTGASHTIYNWAGYGLCVNTTNTFGNCDGNLFTSVAGLYTEPSYNDYSCAGQSVGGYAVPPADLIWAGIGGIGEPGGSTVLAQTGTAHQGSGAPNVGGVNHGTWYEVVPGMAITPYPQNEFAANIGDSVVPIVQYVDGIYYFEVYDETTGQTSTASVVAGYTGESAEVVVERPEVTINGVNYLTPLGNFTSPIGFASEADGAWFSQYPSTDARWGIHMIQGTTGQDLADPGDIYAPDGDFFVTYSNCGGIELVKSGG